MSWVAVDGEHLATLRQKANELKQAEDRLSRLQYQVREAEKMLSQGHRHEALISLRMAIGSPAGGR